MPHLVFLLLFECLTQVGIVLASEVPQGQCIKSVSGISTCLLPVSSCWVCRHVTVICCYLSLCETHVCNGRATLTNSRQKKRQTREEAWKPSKSASMVFRLLWSFTETFGWPLHTFRNETINGLLTSELQQKHWLLITNQV